MFLERFLLFYVSWDVISTKLICSQGTNTEKMSCFFCQNFCIKSSSLILNTKVDLKKGTLQWVMKQGQRLRDIGYGTTQKLVPAKIGTSDNFSKGQFAPCGSKR